ncbi:ABC transporter permease [Anaerofustis stercorihominis]|nr:ABC transporter permease [Anaerofustis stercorihominis]MCQ4794821.1 ABC transporter permease [Anaerofustis stercorihominis]
MIIESFKSFISIFKSNIKNRKKSISMAKMTLKKRYSGSALGVGWSLVKPILFIFVYWFGIEIGIRGGKPIQGEIPYIFWLMTGIIAWFFINDVLNIGISSIRKDSHLVTKVVFPVETIPVYNVMALFFTHLLLLGLVVIVLAIFGFLPNIYYLQLIYYISFLFFFCCVLCTFLSTLAVVSRDFEQLVKSTTMIFFWLSPVIWTADKIGEGSILMRLLKLNPFYYFIQGYRDTFLFKIWFFERPYYTIYMIIFMIILTLVTSYLYRKLHNDFSDVL